MNIIDKWIESSLENQEVLLVYTDPGNSGIFDAGVVVRTGSEWLLLNKIDKLSCFDSYVFLQRENIYKVNKGIPSFDARSQGENAFPESPIKLKSCTLDGFLEWLSENGRACEVTDVFGQDDEGFIEAWDEEDLSIQCYQTELHYSGLAIIKKENIFKIECFTPDLKRLEDTFRIPRI